MILNIRTTLENTDTLTDLLPIVQNSSDHISLFGSRYIKVLGYTGSLYIDDLARKVINVVLPITYKCDSEAERQTGMEITDLVDRIYKSNDNKLRNINIFSRFLADSRCVMYQIYYSLKNNCYPVRTYWDIYDMDKFFLEDSELFKDYSDGRFINPRPNIGWLLR